MSPFDGLLLPRTALWSSKQSAIDQRDWGFFTVQGGVDQRKLGLLPRLIEVLDMWNDLWTGEGTPNTPEVELAQYTNPGQLENRSMGLGFPHRGEVSTRMISVFVLGLSEL